MAKPEKHTCESCGGNRKCNNCDGRGKVRDYIAALVTFGIATWNTCSACDGKRKCPACDGKGFYWSDKR